MLMQQNYSPSLEAESIRLALDAAHKRQGSKHQQTLMRLRLLARLINI